jgi:hypothetical protein
MLVGVRVGVWMRVQGDAPHTHAHAHPARAQMLFQRTDVLMHHVHCLHSLKEQTRMLIASKLVMVTVGHGGGRGGGGGGGGSGRGRGRQGAAGDLLACAPQPGAPAAGLPHPLPAQTGARGQRSCARVRDQAWACAWRASQGFLTIKPDLRHGPP